MTLFELVTSEKIKMSNSDLKLLGMIFAAKAKSMGCIITKRWEKQPDDNYLVNDYLSDIEDVMKDCVVEFLKSKK